MRINFLRNKYQLAHFIGGFATPIAATINWSIGIIMLISFFTYEVVEWIIRSDNFVVDTRTYVVGLYLSSIIIIILEVIKWIGMVH